MTPRTAALLLAASLLTVAGAAGCGGDRPPAADETRTPEAAAPAEPIDPATVATVTGRVTFTGTPPAAAPIRMGADPNCPQDGAAVSESVVVHDGALKNAFVYVAEGLGNRRFPAPATPVVLDQQGCHYTPHVLGIRVGQPLEIVNSDATLHNVHALPHTNSEFNTGQPVKGMRHTHTFTTSEVMVPFKCDVHRWMTAHVGVLDHPFFAVTGDDGSFSLAGLPPGTYTLEVWHETLGRQSLSVTLAAKDSRAVSFVFPAGPATGA